MNFSKQISFYKFEWDELSLIRKLHLNRAILNIFIYKPYIATSCHDDVDIFFFKSMFRSDYDKFMGLVTKNAKSSLISTLEYRFAFNGSLFSHLDIARQIWSESKGLNFGARAYILFSILRYVDLIEETKIIKPKLVVVHAEMQPAENFLVHLFKSRNITTVTLQHGLYVDYSSSRNINVINYENVSTDYFISWGRKTKELVEEFNSTNVIVAGAPHLKNIDVFDRHSSDFITVIFDQNMFYEYNCKLLEIAYSIAVKLNLQLNVRFHPRNVESSYNINRRNIILNGDVYRSKFVLAHTTSFAIELMRLDIPVYVLNSNIPALDYPVHIIFDSVDEFLVKHSVNTTDYVKLASDYIFFCGDESVLRYNNIFDELVRSSGSV